MKIKGTGLYAGNAATPVFHNHKGILVQKMVPVEGRRNLNIFLAYIITCIGISII